MRYCLLGSLGLALRTDETLLKYCADPSDAGYHTSRCPPKLSDDALALEPVLIHLETIFRHGPRAPAVDRQCWAEMTAKWDCPEMVLKFSKGGPLEPEEGDTQSIIFSKVYDAQPGSNVFLGTCEKGQLLNADGSKIFGECLAESYFDQDDDGTLTLIAPEGGPLINFADNPPGDDKIWFRSTDKSRTILTGANVLAAMLAHPSSGIDTGTSMSIPHHIMDYEREVISPNTKWCLEQHDTHLEAEDSSLMKAMRQRHVDIKNKMTATAKVDELPDWPVGMIDCLYTHACGNFEDDMPVGLKPGEPDFNEGLNAVLDEEMLPYWYNDSAFSKALIGSLVLDTKGHLYNSMMGESMDMGVFDEFVGIKERAAELKTEKGSPKFVVWSAHDTTVMPWLAAMGKEFWLKVSGGEDLVYPPYQSVILQEFYKVSDKVMFRLIWNGVDVTQHYPGCPEMGKLCDIEHFLTTTQDFANKNIVDKQCQGVPPQPEGTLRSLTKSVLLLIGFWLM